MPRSFCLALATILSLFTLNLATAQSADAPTTTPEEQIAKLKSENNKLKKEVSDAAQTITKLQGQLTDAQQAQQKQQQQDQDQIQKLQAQVTQLQQTPAAPGAPGAPDATAAADTAGSRTYTVVKGDKLWTIAHKMYPGHTKEGVDKIQEANKDALGNKPLKIGQVLIIPQ
jgi:nucleoid-associated protein YgaU